MLSRVGESIFRMSRYLERAENVARFISVNHQMMLDMPTGEATQWMPTRQRHRRRCRVPRAFQGIDPG